MDLSWLVAVTISVICTLIFLLKRWKKYTDNYWEKRGITLLKQNPFFQTLIDMITGKKGTTDLLKDFYTNCGSDVAGYFQFHAPALLIRSPEIINHILIKDFSHFEDRIPQNKHRSSGSLSLGLGNLSGDEWRNARQKLTPTFTSGRLKIMADTMKDKSDEVVVFLKDKTNQEIEARELSLKFILNVIGEVAFGFKVDALNETAATNDFLSASTKFFKPSYKQLLTQIAIMFLPDLSHFLKLKNVDNDVHDFFLKLTVDAIRHRENNKIRKNDFLQLMIDQKNKEFEETLNKTQQNNGSLQNENKYNLDVNEMNVPITTKNSTKSSVTFTEEFMASQSFTFISTGSETIATVLSFVLFELAVNQNYQKQVQQEIDTIVAKDGFDYQAIKKMKYMEQFINETFRVHPPFSAQARVCTKEYKIPRTDCVIEKGTFISIPVIGLHNDPQYFPEPQKFNPDRFENMDAIPKGVFFSFSYGPRMCIADRLAMLEMKVFLAVLLSSYTVVLGSRTKVPLKIMKNALVSHVEGGIWVKFEKRII